MVIRGQTHKNVSVRRPHRGRIAVRKIDAAIGQTYVVNDALHLFGRNLPPNGLLDLVTKVGGFFNSHSGGSSEMKFEGASVHTGEEIAPQPGDQNGQRAEAAGEEHNQECTPMLEASLQQTPIALAEFFEGFLKTLLDSYEWIAAGSISWLLFFSP